MRSTLIISPVYRAEVMEVQFNISFFVASSSNISVTNTTTDCLN